MATYTFADAKDPRDGTTELVIASGPVAIGESANFTVAEYNALRLDYDLRAGVVAIPPNNTKAFRIPARSPAKPIPPTRP